MEIRPVTRCENDPKSTTQVQNLKFYEQTVNDEVLDQELAHIPVKKIRKKNPLPGCRKFRFRHFASKKGRSETPVKPFFSLCEQKGRSDLKTRGVCLIW